MKIISSTFNTKAIDFYKHRGYVNRQTDLYKNLGK